MGGTGGIEVIPALDAIGVDILEEEKEK